MFATLNVLSKQAPFALFAEIAAVRAVFPVRLTSFRDFILTDRAVLYLLKTAIETHVAFIAKLTEIIAVKHAEILVTTFTVLSVIVFHAAVAAVIPGAAVTKAPEHVRAIPNVFVTFGTVISCRFTAILAHCPFSVLIRAFFADFNGLEATSASNAMITLHLGTVLADEMVVIRTFITNR